MHDDPIQMMTALDLGLAEAIGFYHRHTRREGDPELDVDSSLDRDVPQETRLTIYRACQEALNNARRHARASRVLVRLREQEGGVLVEVSDDGVGFRAAEEHPSDPGHLGLVAMRERAELAGGRFDIHARPDAGTTVEMWFPLPVESEGPAHPTRLFSARSPRLVPSAVTETEAARRSTEANVGSPGTITEVMVRVCERAARALGALSDRVHTEPFLHEPRPW